MHRDDYDRLRYRVCGPLYEAGEYLTLPGVQKDVTLCDEGHFLLAQARASVSLAQQHARLLVQYVERMHGFEP